MNNRLKDALIYCGVWKAPQTYGKSIPNYGLRWYAVWWMKAMKQNDRELCALLNSMFARQYSKYVKRYTIHEAFINDEVKIYNKRNVLE